MLVDGVKIREALSRYKTIAETLASQFKESCWAFEGEAGLSPCEMDRQAKEAEEAVAELEELQQLYNLITTVEVCGTVITLANAVKLVGSAGRRAKAWKEVARDNGRDRYSDRRTRSKDEITAKRTISVKDALAEHANAERYASQLRSAIARGNMTTYNVGPCAADKPELNRFRPSLFE